MTESHAGWKGAVLAVAAALSLGITLLLPPLPQDPSYHEFADSRTFLGLPHAFDVLSNLPFLVVGAGGLYNLFGPRPTLFLLPWERWPWALFMTGLLVTAFGSSYYHYGPRNATLF